jgi:hypothetical protein
VKWFVYVLLVVIAGWAGILCGLTAFSAKTAIHETQAAIFLLIVAVCAAGVGIMTTVMEMTDRLPKPRPKPPMQQ